MIPGSNASSSHCASCYCRDHVGELPAILKRARPLPCVHLGNETGERVVCGSCLDSEGQPTRTKIKLFACDVHGQCSLGMKLDGLACCSHGKTGCLDYSPKLPPSLFAPDASDVPCGVVIGTYTSWPALIELQIRAIRQHCGDTPILIADDCSPAAADIQAVCGRYKSVAFWPNVERIGHAGGDLSAIWKGFQWAEARQLRILAKLSQRFLADTTRWLHDGAKDLLASGLAIAMRSCRGPIENYPYRSEAMLLDVAKWGRPSVLADLSPARCRGRDGETALYDVAKKHSVDTLHPWSFLKTEDRYQWAPGYLWHCANTPAEYHDLAARHGLALPPEFHTNGWHVTSPATHLVG